ncbi:MAG: hypothetical protein PVJ57_07705 [Phycisphaerae bacterium]|jgi:hypothetical protein
MRAIIATLWLAVGVGVCGDIQYFDGGPCEYADTPGVATVVSVSPADPGDPNCWNDPVEVVFDYVPDDPELAHLAVSGIRLTISEGVNPPATWVEDEGLTAGSPHPCLRRDITSGACTPLLFELLDVDYEAGIDQCYDGAFTMTVVPEQVYDAVYGQRIVVLVSVEDNGQTPVPEPVHITVSSSQADITVVPAYILPGQVCEATAIPRPRLAFGAGSKPLHSAGQRGYPEGDDVVITVCGERNGAEQSAELHVNVLYGGDGWLEYATMVRERFIPYLAEQHPELGITPQTVWTGTIVKPHILVVTHYLFFSAEWEMGIMWHNTIPPYDWSRIYLRHRYTDMTPTYAFEISSFSAQPPEQPHPIDPPAEVDR